VPAAYTRYLVGRLTEAFRLVGVPLRLALRARRAVSAPRARGSTARARGTRPPRRGGAPPRPRWAHASRGPRCRALAEPARPLPSWQRLLLVV